MRAQRAEVIKQASFDGLCGIFCLVNAIRNWDEHSFEANDPDSLRYLLEAADRLRIFSTHRVMGGFEVHEMIDVFREFARAHRFPGEASHLSAIADKKKRPFLAEAELFLKEGGQIILPVDAGKHWVLAYAYDKARARFLVEDPDPGSDRTKITPQDIYKGGREGVLLRRLILPLSSGINAQS